MPFSKHGSAFAAVKLDLHPHCPATHALCAAPRPASDGVALFRDFYGYLAGLLQAAGCGPPDNFTVLWVRREEKPPQTLSA